MSCPGEVTILFFGLSGHDHSESFGRRLQGVVESARLAGKRAHVVYIASDASKAEFDAYTRRASADTNWLALPFSQRLSLGERARQHFLAERVPWAVVTQGAGGCVEVLNEDGVSDLSRDVRAVRYPWRRLSVEELLGPRCVKRDENGIPRSQSRSEALAKCQVLALYFGASWCSHCVTFRPVLDAAYKAIEARQGKGAFEVFYVSLDTSYQQFADYFREMDWLAVPRDDEERRMGAEASADAEEAGPAGDIEGLKARFAVSEFPLVVLLQRDSVRPGAGFTLMPDGRNGRKLLSSKDPNALAFDFPFRGYPLVTRLDQCLSALDSSVALLILCEHLLLLSSDYPRLLGVLEAVASWYHARPEVVERNPRWPKLKFVIATGPPGGEHSAWLRNMCGLQPASDRTENLQVLILDQRWDLSNNASYLMRGVCALESWGKFDLPSLVGNGGKRLMSFVEIFNTQIQPRMHEHMMDETSPYHGPKVRMPLLASSPLIVALLDHLERKKRRKYLAMVPEITAAMQAEDAAHICTFCFLSADFIRRLPANTITLPKCQDLVKTPGALKLLDIRRDLAFNGRYIDTYLAVSHRWLAPDAPDKGGEQFAAIKKYVVDHPKVEWVWYDFWCMVRATR